MAEYIPANEMPRDANGYPIGTIIGPCICGSWPGGRCLRCTRLDPHRPAAANLLVRFLDAGPIWLVLPIGLTLWLVLADVGGRRR